MCVAYQSPIIYFAKTTSHMIEDRFRFFFNIWYRQLKQFKSDKKLRDVYNPEYGVYN